MTNTETFPAHSIDDLVRIVPAMAGKHGRTVFRVTAVPGGRRTKTVAVPLGGGLGVKGDPRLFERLSAEEARMINEANSVAPVPPMTLGSVVTVAGKGEERFVVIKLGVDRINVARLGGDGGRYLRVPPRLLSVVEV